MNVLYVDSSGTINESWAGDMAMTTSMLSIPQMKPAIVPFLPPTVSILQYNTLCKAYGF